MSAHSRLARIACFSIALSSVALSSALVCLFVLSFALCAPVWGQTTRADSTRSGPLVSGRLSVEASRSAEEHASDGQPTEARYGAPVSLAPNRVSNSPALRRAVSLQLDGVTLERALRRIAAKGGLKLAYLRETVASEKVVSLRAEHITMREALREVLRGTGLGLVRTGGGQFVVTRRPAPKMGHAVLERASVRVPAKVEVQTGTIAGMVTDSTTGEPLPGVNVVIAGTQQGAATDAQGHFVISDLEAGTYDLTASFVGYTTKRIEDIQVTADDTTRVDIALSSARVGLEEVVVVGYGTEAVENLTGSVSVVDAAAFDDRALTNAVNALQGQVPGLTVIQRSAKPGANAGTLRIRGIGTLGGGGKKSPLILVDGIPTSLSAVAPSDIKSITVLKDAASAAIYGVRAANGVILVTTKRGPREGVQFSYSGYVGVQTPTRLPNFLGSADYARLYNEALMNEGREPIYTQEEIAKYESGQYPNRYPSTDWLHLFLDPAFQQSHYFSLGGGAEAVRYRASFRYLNQHGLVPTLTSNKYNLRINLDTDVNERLHFAVSLAAQRKVGDRPYHSAERLMYELLRIPPTVPNRYSDGTWGYHKEGQNPIRKALQDGYDRWESTRLRGSILAEYTLLEGVTARGRFGIDTYDGLHTTFRRQLTYRDFETGDVKLVQDPAELLNWDGRRRGITLEGFLNVDQTFGSHHVKALVGYSQETFRDEWFRARRQGFPSNALSELNAGNPETQENAGSTSSWALRSVFGRIQYAFMDRYLFEANARYDGSSRFPEGNRYGLFPSFSAGWRISEEPFFDVGFISNLKLRASWGRLGNQQIGVYPYQSTYRYGANYPLGGQLVSGAVEARLSNKNITWETTTVTDVGVDLGLLEGRLRLTADYFYKVTDGILLTLPIPASVGIGAPPQNAANVLNRGWEFAGEYRGHIGDFRYRLSGNLSFVHNEITDLAGTGTQIKGTYGNVVGDPINSLYGYEAMGFFQSAEQVENHAFQNPATAPGDIIYKDQNGDGEINAEDRVYLGSYFPGITYGATFSANYKGFDLRVFLQGVGQTKGYLTGMTTRAFFKSGKVQEWHLDRWTPENRDASYPRLLISKKHNQRPSSFWVQDASYLRVENVQLGYTLPESLLSRFGVSQMRLYVNADNLYTFTGFRGYDPETPLGNAYFYPLVTTYTFGINLTI